MSEYAINIQGITKVFGQKTVVDNLSLQVKKGAIFGFLGSNGSGKTTMIRMICGLLTPTHGDGSCLGYNIRTQSDEIKTKIGYMPQQFSLYPKLTVYETLTFFGDIYHISEASRAIETIIKDLSLEPYAHIKAGHLSGGWKQRLTLACCLLHQPKLLFLDEPTAGIDPKARKDFWNYLHQIATRDGTTVLVTTHYMDEAEKCTDLAYIHNGKLLYTGPTRDLIPFSHVKTYIAQTKHTPIQVLTSLIQRDYPNILVSWVNNDLRISSSNHAPLTQLIHEQSEFTFSEVPPSFEEVFIGLMQ
jgi:ABC-2 type transport system ATP-binding protein